MSELRVLIVDDEPLARRRIAALLEEEPEVEVVGECGDGAEAVRAIAATRPDLVFLDVQMPEVDGLEVVEQVGPENMPAVVFATAYDRYALRAFDLHAVDYLLKPFSRERFERAMERARETVLRARSGRSDATEQKLLSLLREMRRDPERVERLAVTSGERTVLIRVGDVDWVESEANYVRLHVGGEAHLLRGTLKAMEARLDPEQFLRISRAHIVNLDRIREIQPWFRGDFVVVLENGTKLQSSGSYSRKLRELTRNRL